jgi:hypothetical protein
MQRDRHLGSGDLCREGAPLGQGSRASLLALSGCCAASAKRRRLKNFQATASAVRQVCIAAARSVRCVGADVRWRWTLNVL